VSLGSLGELSYVLDLAGNLGYLHAKDLANLRTVHTQASQLTWRLYQYHRRTGGQ
jgi:hypothetical protein